MSRHRSASSLFPPLLIAALVALALLATLQYSWVSQVSAGDRERRQAGLVLSARRFSEDFNRELARVYLSFQMDAETLQNKDWSRYAQRYDRWVATAPYPGLVKTIYLAEVNQIGGVNLYRFDPAEGRFFTQAWPYQMLALRRDFEHAYREIFAQGDRVRVMVNPITSDAGSLLVPVARPWLLSDQQDLGINADLIFSDLLFPGTFNRCARCPPELYDTPLIAYTVVVLDRVYMTKAFVPALIERHFPRGGSDYHFAVINRADPDQLIYASADQLGPQSFATSDLATGVFAISYHDLNALLLASDLRFDDQGDDSARGPLVLGVLGSPDDDPLSPTAADRGRWQLVIKHRDGSLDAAANNLRLRNLLISFGTLLLLGGSVAMMLVSARRAQRLAQQQIEFASAVSHELRTPLAVICSAGENLADGLVHDPQKARRYGTVIFSEGRRLTEMVEQVLAFAGAQSGRQRYETQPVEVAELIEGAIHGLQHQLREGQYRLALQIAPDLPLIMADKIALRRSIQNLISNAMKYGGPERWIGVEAALVRGERSCEIQISVSDRGIGIDKADLTHIFEPFYRGRGAMAMPAHGSGLGLSLVKHAVEAHGGRVSVASAPSQGTRFTLHLPLADAPAYPIAGEDADFAGTVGSPLAIAGEGVGEARTSASPLSNAGEGADFASAVGSPRSIAVEVDGFNGKKPYEQAHPAGGR